MHLITICFFHNMDENVITYKILTVFPRIQGDPHLKLAWKWQMSKLNFNKNKETHACEI